MQKVITHSGILHADEVLAIAALQLGVSLHLVDGGIPVTRTRAPKALEEAKASSSTFVIDVGGEHNPAANNFDHHQVGFGSGEGETHPEGTKEAAFGLVWDKYGEEVVRVITAEECGKIIRRVAEKVRKALVIHVDDVDNGAANEVGSAHISAIISSFNRSWKDEPSMTGDEEFTQAVDFARGILTRAVKSAHAEVTAQAIVQACIQEAQSDDHTSDPMVVVLPHYVPYQGAVASWNAAESRKVKAVVFPDERGEWRVVGCEREPGQRVTQALLPKEWREMSQPQLAQLDAHPRFVHASGFTGGALLKAEILLMARAMLWADCDLSGQAVLDLLSENNVCTLSWDNPKEVWETAITWLAGRLGVSQEDAYYMVNKAAQVQSREACRTSM